MPTTSRLSLPAYALHQLSRLVYPVFCVGCGNPMHALTQPLCGNCLRLLPATHSERVSNSPITNLFAGRLPIQRADALLFFVSGGVVQHVIHAFKYKNRQDVARFMGRWMGNLLLQAPHYPMPDALVPLPLYRNKLKKRGYNQALLLAEGMGEVLQIPVAPVAVMRTRHTETQTRKSRIDRWLNVAEVFDLNNADQLAGKKLLLVDDVITTGATMEACGHQLLRIPGVSLSLISLAFAHSV